MRTERRRRARRRDARWTARYRLGGAAAWRACELVDVSEGGAGFQAYLLPTDVRLGAGVEIELLDEAGSAPDRLRLPGVIRHVTRSDAGQVRVGVEFVGLSELEYRLIALLVRRDAAARQRQHVSSLAVVVR